MSEREEQERDGDGRLCDIRHGALEERLQTLWARVDDRFTALDERTRLALTSAKDAVDKAERLAGERAAQQNEWRGTINDVISTMMPRSEYTLAQRALGEKTDTLAGRLDRLEGRAGGVGTTVAWLFAGMGVLVAIGSLIIAFMGR